VHGNRPPRLLGGGSAANTAAALAQLGVSTRFVGTVGDDGYGRFAVADLAAAGVDTSAILETTAAPTVMVVVVIPPNGERLIYVWPPTGGAHAALAPKDAVAAVAGAEWLHVSGICLRVEPAREALLAAMERARSDATPVSFDLNLRLENWGWDNGFREVALKAIDHADVVVGAVHDEIAALASVEDPIGAALSLAGDHRLVIARLGADGAVACSAQGVVAVPGFPVDVVDTVGAGDAFNAGFIAARLRGSDIEASTRWGNAVAALSITRPGARSSPTFEEAVALTES
jgi:fructokinase/2-dehydro-3-deoxygluconokinase